MGLKELLDEKGITMYRLAMMTGLSRAGIVDLCNERIKLTRSQSGTVYRIAKALDVSMESLLDEPMKNEMKS